MNNALHRSRALRTLLPAMLVLVVAGLAFRWLWFGWPIHSLATADTPGYTNMMLGLLSGSGFNNDSYGIRTPGYPLLLAGVSVLFGARYLDATVIVHSILGMAAAGLILVLTYQAFNRLWLALLAGMAVALDPAHMQFEHYILTESLATFLLVLTFALSAYVLKSRSLPWAIGLGLTMACLALVRPVFAALPLLVGSLLWLAGRMSDFKPVPRRSLVLLLAVSLGLPGLWIVRNYLRYDVAGISTMGGCSLSQHAGGFLEGTAPSSASEQAVQRLYLEQRAKLIASTGSHANTVWWAMPDIERETGLTPAQVCNTLLRLSLKSIYKAPLAYFDSVKASWRASWQPFLVTVPAFLETPPWLWIYLEAYRAAMTGFLVLSVAFVSIVAYRHRSPWLRQHEFLLVVALLVILYLLVLSSVLEFGENGRLGTPAQPLIAVWLVWGTAWLVRCVMPSSREGSC